MFNNLWWLTVVIKIKPGVFSLVHNTSWDSESISLITSIPLPITTVIQQLWTALPCFSLLKSFPLSALWTCWSLFPEISPPPPQPDSTTFRYELRCHCKWSFPEHLTHRGHSDTVYCIPALKFSATHLPLCNTFLNHLWMTCLSPTIMELLI